jgi:hypothetical protein
MRTYCAPAPATLPENTASELGETTVNKRGENIRLDKNQ